MRIERLGTGDDAKVAQAGALFDGPARADATRRFLGDRGHHLLIAYVGDTPVGFVTGVEMTHPDKGSEMFLYELGVAEAHRRQGIGKALVAALARLAREAGCYGMWALTDQDNRAALATYRAAGAAREPDTVLLGWEFPRRPTSQPAGGGA
jgi:ribosomal-protein-alanine N-acetyltransferase